MPATHHYTCQLCGLQFLDSPSAKRKTCGVKCARNNPTSIKSPIKRFRKNVVVKPSGCWEWSKSKGHYGNFSQDGVYIRAHRFSYITWVDPDVEGKEVHHLCDNLPCVNPTHLVAIPNPLHVHQSINVGHLNGLKTHCPLGHPYKGENLVVSKRGSRLCRQCIREKSRAIPLLLPRKSKYRGLCLNRKDGTWKTEIKVAGRMKYIGTYATEEEAALAWNNTALSLSHIRPKVIRLNQIP